MPALVGASCALLLSGCLYLLRSRGLTGLNIEKGLGGILGESTFVPWLGLVWHLVNGSILGLLFGKILSRFGWGVCEGLCLGFVYWFLASMAIGTFPVLDILSAPGTPRAGPFAIFLGGFSFYLLLLFHLGFGGAIGWCSAFKRGARV